MRAERPSNDTSRWTLKAMGFSFAIEAIEPGKSLDSCAVTWGAAAYGHLRVCRVNGDAVRATIFLLVAGDTNTDRLDISNNTNAKSWLSTNAADVEKSPALQ